MDLDRQSIERRDFPIARRGYDPASVDRHLAGVADAFDDLRTRSAAGGLDAGTRRLQAQLDGVHREMETLLASLRAGAARVAERLAAVEGELPAVVAQPPRQRATLPSPPAPSHQPVTPPAAQHEEPAGAVRRTRTAGRIDTEGARLVALDMALAGQPRDQVDAYLAEHFAGVDRGAVLDAVYASI